MPDINKHEIEIKDLKSQNIVDFEKDKLQAKQIENLQQQINALNRKLDLILRYNGYYVHPATHPANMITGLSPVATTGQYSDLLGKPTNLSNFTNDLKYSTVAKTGNYSDLLNKPTKLSDFTNDLELSSSTGNINYSDIIGRPTNLSDFNNDLDLSTVANTGSYNDLLNKPTSLSQFNNDLGLARVATSGSYNDLTDRPTKLSDFINDLDFGSVSSVKLSVNSITINKGSSYQLTATVLPSNAANKNVTWSSSDTTVATVTNGVVTSIKEGSVTITVTTVDGGFTDTCLINVVASSSIVPVNDISLSNHSLTLDTVGGSYTLTYTILPNNATNKNVTWLTSNPTVLSVNNGVITANANGLATITVKTTDGGYTDTCNVTVYDENYVEPELDNTLYVPDIASYGIYNDGTNSTSTTNGLNTLFEDLNKAKKSKIQLPTGTYAIDPELTVNLKSNMSIDMNGSTFKIDTNGKNGSTMFYTKDVENITLKNGTIEGDRYEHDYSTYDANTTSHEFNVGLKLDQGSRNINIDNVTFTKITGYALATFQGTQYCNTPLDKTIMESGNYDDNGNKIDDVTTIRYPNKVDITEHATYGYLQVGTLLKYQNYVFNSTRVVTVLIFDSNDTLLTKTTSNMYRPIVVPTNASYCYLVFNQSDPKDYLKGDIYTLDVFHMKPPRDCNITNCTFDDNRCLGIAVCGGWNIKIEGNTIKNTSKPTSDTSSPNYQHGKPGYAIDIEDGWESTQDLTINNNIFTNNGFGDIVSLAGDNTVITNNQFTGRVAMYSRNTNYIAQNNTFETSIAMWETEKDYGFTVDHNTYTNTTIKAKCHNSYGVDYYSFTNETITNGQMQLDTSVTLKNSTITLDGVTNSRFTGAYDTCTISNFDGSDSNSDYNTGIKLNNCNVSTCNFFPSKDCIMTNNTFDKFRVRLDGGTLVFTGNEIQSNPKNISMPIVQLNGGTSATIKDNTLGKDVTVPLYTNPAGITVITE